MLGLGSAASFFATGYLALGQHRCPASVPAPDTGPALAARAAVNELMMCGLILTSWPVAVGTIAVRVQREATEAYALFDEKGWFSEPATYHKDPPPLEEPEIEIIEHKGREIERLSFDSLYEPHEIEPGRERCCVPSLRSRSSLWSHTNAEPFSPASSTGWCRRSRTTASGATGNSRASAGTREPTSALYAPPKAVRSSKRPSAPPTCFPRRRQVPLLIALSGRGLPSAKRAGQLVSTPAGFARRLVSHGLRYAKAEMLVVLTS